MGNMLCAKKKARGKNKFKARCKGLKYTRTGRYDLKEIDSESEESREYGSFPNNVAACNGDENDRTYNDDDETELKIVSTEGSIPIHINTHSDEDNRSSKDGDRTKLIVQIPEEDIVDLFYKIDTHSECERNHTKLESRIAERLFHLEQDFSDEIQSSRQQSRLELEQEITYIRIGTGLPYCKGHEFGAIYKAMPDARRRFTVQLVQKYAWLKEEMTESVARNVAQRCLSVHHLEYLQLNCNKRKTYVGHFLKMVLRCGKQLIEFEFLNALQTEGAEGIRFANAVEHSLVTNEQIKAFEDLQRERNQYRISEDRLPSVCFHAFEVDLVNDEFFSRLFFSYKEHSDIEESNEKSNGKSSLFFETFRKCQENVFDDLKCICDAYDIFIHENTQRDAISDTTTLPSSAQRTHASLSKRSLEVPGILSEDTAAVCTGSAPRISQDRPVTCKKTKDKSTITDVIINEPSTPPSLQKIGIATIHTHEGSLIMILKLANGQSLTNLKDKCEDGSIGDVLIDVLQRKDVLERLDPGTYHFNMTLHATTEDAHFVEMKINGSVFDQKEQMCKHRTAKVKRKSTEIFCTDDDQSTEHPRYICDELEISDHLLDVLYMKKIVPHDITRKLREKVNRRDKIHELLFHYNIRMDNGFRTLSEYIKMVRELRGKKAYPLKLFEGKFVTIYDGSCFRIVHIGIRVTWASSSVPGKSESQSETTPGAAHFVYCDDDCSSAKPFLKLFAKSGFYCQATEMTRFEREFTFDSTTIMILCSSYQDHWQRIGNFWSDHFKESAYPFTVASIHDDELKDDTVDDWLNKNIGMPYKAYQVNLSDMDNQKLVEHLLHEHEHFVEFEERPKTIIIQHLKGSFEYENIIYTEVINQGLGCRIVSKFEAWYFANPDSVPCVVIHKGINIHNERSLHHSKKVWEVLLIDIDNKAVEHAHTMMKGLRYRMHDINLENVRWPQELLQQLTGIQKRSDDGTAYEVCICFDLPSVKYANIVYKGLKSIGIRCIYAQETLPEVNYQCKSGVWLQRVNGKDIESGLDIVNKVYNEGLYVWVIDSPSTIDNAPFNARSISIRLDDKDWPHKVKARLEEPLDEQRYQRSSSQFSSDRCLYQRSVISIKVTGKEFSSADCVGKSSTQNSTCQLM